MLHFLFPFRARETIAVSGIPAGRPHPKDEASRDDERWSEFLLIDFSSVSAYLRTFVSGSHGRSPVSGQLGSLLIVL